MMVLAAMVVMVVMVLFNVVAMRVIVYRNYCGCGSSSYPGGHAYTPNSRSFHSHGFSRNHVGLLYMSDPLITSPAIAHAS